MCPLKTSTEGKRLKVAFVLALNIHLDCARPMGGSPHLASYLAEGRSLTLCQHLDTVRDSHNPDQCALIEFPPTELAVNVTTLEG